MRDARRRHGSGTLRWDYYDILGLEQAATSSDIKAAYKRQALRSHPDKGGSSEQFRLVVKAFEVLFNASARQSYDRQRRIQRHECPAPHPAPASAQQHKPSRSAASSGATQEPTSVGRQHGTTQLRRSKPEILARYLSRLRRCLAECPRRIRQDVISKMSLLLRQKLLEQMEAAVGTCGACLPQGDPPSACSEVSPVSRDDETPKNSAPALSIENQVQGGPLQEEVECRVDFQGPASSAGAGLKRHGRKLYRGVNTLKSRGFMYYEARLSVRNLTLASRATRTLEEAVHNHTLLATFRQIFSEKEAGVKDSTAKLTAQNLQKALEETEGLSDVGLSLQVVMDARPWVGKMVTSPRTQEISKAISMWMQAEVARLEGWPAMSAVWLEWMQMGRRERFNIRSKSLSQAQQTIWAAEQSYRPQWTKRQERRAAREWRQQQESERQELRRQEQKSREEQRWQRLVEGRLARLLLRAENCAQSLENKEYGITIQDSGREFRGQPQSFTAMVFDNDS